MMIITSTPGVAALLVLLGLASTLIHYSQGAWVISEPRIQRTMSSMMELNKDSMHPNRLSSACTLSGLDHSNTSTQTTESQFSRRGLFRQLTWATAFSTLFTASSLPTYAQEPPPPTTTTTCVPEPDGSTTCDSPASNCDVKAMSAEQVAEWLRGIPTFSLVDTEGVPYMVVGEDAKVTGYFFTSFDEAKRILQLARRSTDKAIKEQVEKAKRGGGDKSNDDETLVNPWKQARISSVPLDLAVTLVTKSTKANIFYMAPTADDINQALEITGLDDLAEGKVPLFYLEDFTDSNGKSPLYFTKSQLLQDYKKNNKTKQTTPPVLVTELFGVLGQMVQGGNADVQNLVLVPPANSLQQAKECIRQGGSNPPFVIGQRNLVL